MVPLVELRARYIPATSTTASPGDQPPADACVLWYQGIAARVPPPGDRPEERYANVTPNVATTATM